MRILGNLLVAVLLALGVEAQPVVEQVIDVARVPADFRVRFCLLTEREYQFVGYYDAQRRMTVAMRRLDEDRWTCQVLASEVGWDSHNSITLALDQEGCLHVSGNMHAVPLVYFRASKPWDVLSLAKQAMTGTLENRATYPVFLKDGEGRLIFHYRDGGSGNGSSIWNRYDVEKRKWSRLLDTPLFDGEGERNAYPSGVSRDSKGWYHMNWVWRDTPDSATNHHLSHARSRDLIAWESASGKRVSLPITLDQEESWVDPIPSGGGIINGGTRMIFARDGQPVLVYHKADERWHMQIYAARPQGEGWKRQVLTDWKKPIEFGGGGSMPFIGISLGRLLAVEPGVLAVEYRHKDYGSGVVGFAEDTLQPVSREIRLPVEYPKEMGRLQGAFPGLGIRRAEDSGASGEKGIRYVLQWESLGSNRDKRPDPPFPEPSMLRLYRLRDPAD